MRSASAKQAYLIILLQTSLAIVSALICGLFMTWHAASSALLGGVVTVIPALIFVRFAYASHGARAAQKILQQFYIGECLKFVSMAILFIAILVCLRIDSGPFIFTFILTQLLALIAPRWFSFRQVEVI